MNFETWIAFALAAAAMLAVPGPTILLVIGQSFGAGRRNGLPLVAGVALGDLSVMAFSLAGLGALLTTSATQFLDPALPFLPQAALLVATLVALGALNAALCALLTGRVSGAIGRPSIRQWLNRAGGSVLVGAGLATAAARRG